MMKALILAAGYGTRLQPHTHFRPKCLFTINRRPLLDIIIHRLIDAGCHAVIINTHHLHEKVEQYIDRQSYPIEVSTKYEPDILGTAGAIRNVADFWNDDPFFVVNSDIVTDVDLAAVYRFHLGHSGSATLVLTDFAAINTVLVDTTGNITGFHESGNSTEIETLQQLTFTGVQVLDVDVLNHIPEGRFYSSIDVFRSMLTDGKFIRAFTDPNDKWHDIGTVSRYRQAVYTSMAPKAFQTIGLDPSPDQIQKVKLKGDGSDRRWYRLVSNRTSLIMVDHGIGTHQATSEAESFVAIGHHLAANGVPVPKIHLYDTFSGVVFMEDLGDVNLQDAVLRDRKKNHTLTWYRQIIRLLVQMSINAYQDFRPEWAHQTPQYDRSVVLEHECRYFVDAFMRGYCGMEADFDTLAAEFGLLADRIMDLAYLGFMHRDYQSRNIMIHADQFYIIDFQSGRIGPVQYDLASLLIDPYVQLPEAIQAKLVSDCLDAYRRNVSCDPRKFAAGYRYCALARNLQILGAFGFLTKEKGKSQFEAHIPAAVRSLTTLVNSFEPNEFKMLKQAAIQLAAIYG